MGGCRVVYQNGCAQPVQSQDCGQIISSTVTLGDCSQALGLPQVQSYPYSGYQMQGQEHRTVYPQYPEMVPLAEPYPAQSSTSQAYQSRGPATLDQKLFLNPGQSVIEKQELVPYLTDHKNGTYSFGFDVKDGGPSSLQYSFSRTSGGFPTELRSYDLTTNNGPMSDGGGAYVMSHRHENGVTKFSVRLTTDQIEGFRVSIGDKTFKIETSEARKLAGEIEQYKQSQRNPGVAQDVPREERTPKQPNTQPNAQQESSRDKTRTPKELDELRQLDQGIKDRAKTLGLNTEYGIFDEVIRDLERIEDFVSPDSNNKYPSIDREVRDDTLKFLSQARDKITRNYLHSDPKDSYRAQRIINNIQEHLRNNHGGSADARHMPGPGDMPGANPDQRDPALSRMPGGSPNQSDPAPGSMPGANPDQSDPALGKLPGGAPNQGDPAPGNMPGANPDQSDPALGNLPGANPDQSNPALDGLPGANLTLASDPSLIKNRNTAVLNLLSLHYDSHSKMTGAFNLHYSPSNGLIQDHKPEDEAQRRALQDAVVAISRDYPNASLPEIFKTKQGSFYCFFGGEGQVTILDRAKMSADQCSQYDSLFEKKDKGENLFGKWISPQVNGKIGYSKYTKVDYNGDYTQALALPKGKETPNSQPVISGFRPAEAIRETLASNMNKFWVTPYYDINDVKLKAVSDPSFAQVLR